MKKKLTAEEFQDGLARIAAWLATEIGFDSLSSMAAEVSDRSGTPETRKGMADFLCRACPIDIENAANPFQVTGTSPEA